MDWIDQNPYRFSMIFPWANPWPQGFLVFALLAGLSAAIGSLVFRITGLRGVWGVGVQSLSIALNAEVQQNDALIFAIGDLG